MTIYKVILKGVKLSYCKTTFLSQLFIFAFLFFIDTFLAFLFADWTIEEQCRVCLYGNFHGNLVTNSLTLENIFVHRDCNNTDNGDDCVNKLYVDNKTRIVSDRFHIHILTNKMG